VGWGLGLGFFLLPCRFLIASSDGFGFGGGFSRRASSSSVIIPLYQSLLKIKKKMVVRL